MAQILMFPIHNIPILSRTFPRVEEMDLQMQENAKKGDLEAIRYQVGKEMHGIEGHLESIESRTMRIWEHVKPLLAE